jgi:hypothetical protein
LAPTSENFMLLSILERLLGCWFVRRHLYDRRVEQLLEENQHLLHLVETSQDLSAAALLELRKRLGRRSNEPADFTSSKQTLH